MQPEHIQNLIDRLQSHGGGHRELDLRMALACGWKQEVACPPDANIITPKIIRWERPDGTSGPQEPYYPPCYSQGTDCALQLIPKEWILSELCELEDCGNKNWFALLHKRGDEYTNNDIGVFAASPALAICIAVLMIPGEYDAT